MTSILAKARMRGGFAVAILCAALLVGSSAQAFDLWPFYVKDREPVAGVATTRALGPIFEAWNFDGEVAEWERIAKGATFTVRPLFSRGQRRGYDRTEFMYPLGAVQGEAFGTSGRFTPIARWGAKGKDDRHPFWTAALAFGGRTEEGQAYGGLFPLYGRAKDRFGKAELEFAAFPIYGKSRDRRDFERLTVAWPFYTRGEGGGRTLVRFWPFYGRDTKEGEYDRRFALWPFIFWRTDRVGQRNERRARFVLPVWGKSETEVTSAEFIGGPLYVHSEHRETGAFTTDTPWPIFRRALYPDSDGGKPTREWRFWPFIRRKVAPTWSETAILFGLIKWRSGEVNGEETTSRRWFFVSRFEDRIDKETGDRIRTRDFWPFFRKTERTAADGQKFGRLVAPWLLPLRGEGFHRHLLGLFTVYEKTYTEDQVRSDFLWGLARYRRKPGYAFDAFAWWSREERQPLGGAVSAQYSGEWDR